MTPDPHHLPPHLIARLDQEIPEDQWWVQRFANLYRSLRAAGLPEDQAVQTACFRMWEVTETMKGNDPEPYVD